MGRHPVTPMDEADLRLHLARQTVVPVGLIDWMALQDADVNARIDSAMQSDSSASRGLVFDVPDRVIQREVGRQLWRHRRDGRSLFVIGSSGVEYALVPEWQALGLLPSTPSATTPIGAVKQIAVVSGSCSAVTAQQIRWAGEHGFALLQVNAALLASRSKGNAEQARVFQLACEALDAGLSVIAYTALGPESLTPRADDAEPHAIGRHLGRLLRDMVLHGDLKRAVVAGGDTSSHALRELDVYALTVAMPLPRTPGSPLCEAHSDNPAFQGLQVALKGGQIGAIDYFDAIRSGRG